MFPKNTVEQVVIVSTLDDAEKGKTTGVIFPEVGNIGYSSAISRVESHLAHLANMGLIKVVALNQDVSSLGSSPLTVTREDATITINSHFIVKTYGALATIPDDVVTAISELTSLDDTDKNKDKISSDTNIANTYFNKGI